jgi:hypothetical protein
MYVSGVNDGMNKIANIVGHDVTLAHFDLLAYSIASRPAVLVGFDALAVDDLGVR